MGDLTATDPYLTILEDKPFWIGQLSHIWTPALRPLLDARLKRLESGDLSTDSNEDHHLSGVLRDIPVPDAEEILTEHWYYLKRRYHFVQVVLYVATERTRGLASRSPPRVGWRQRPF